MAQHFSRDLFAFLRDLKRNNDKHWFEQNKLRFEEDARGPALQFIADFAPHLRKLSRHFRAEPRKVGGSLFRIHRDTRFARDKSPYKTNIGIHFRHEAAKDAHAPGFYLHLEPGGSFAGVGIWHPDSPTTQAIRAAIDDDPKAWKKAAHGKRFRDAFELAGDSLKRPPRGFDADHPWVEDLKRKDFIGLAELSDKEVTQDRFLNTYAGLCKRAEPLMAFLCDATGVRY